jgi:hypothetical protein
MFKQVTRAGGAGLWGTGFEFLTEFNSAEYAPCMGGHDLRRIVESARETSAITNSALVTSNSGIDITRA